MSRARGDALEAGSPAFGRRTRPVEHLTARRYWGMKVSDDGESGQALVLFAVMAAVLVAMLVLVIDSGLIFGQKRYTQNGADAAAFAAARLIKADPATSNLLVYRDVRRYAGLHPTDLASDLPTGVNQSLGLSGRTRLAVKLEYDNGSGWCAAPDARLYDPPTPAPPVPPICGVAPPAYSTAHPYRVRVTVSATTDGFFARSVGLGDPRPPAWCLRPAGAPGITTCARATITVQTIPGTAEYAVFALENDCTLPDLSSGISANSSDVTITGGVHSNSKLSVNGSGNKFNGAVSYTCPGGASFPGSGNRINGALVPPATATRLPSPPADPLGHNFADFPCTHWEGGLANGTLAPNLAQRNLDINRSDLPLDPGVYCANGDITVNGSNIGGQVTFVATGRVTFNGSNYSLTPYLKNVLVFSNYQSGTAFTLNGGNQTWRGVIYAPRGDAVFNGGSSNAMNAAVVANRVHFNGGSWSINGTGQGVTTPQRVATMTE